MPGLSSGVPSTRDYVLGRGILRAASLTAAGLPDNSGFRDLGNAPEFSLTVEVEDLRHQNSRDDTKFTDKRFVVSQEIGLSFQLDEMNMTNLNDFLSGTLEVFDNVAIETAISGANCHIVDGSTTPWVLSRWYQIYTLTNHVKRMYNLGATGLVYTIEEDPDSVSPADLVGTGATADYEIDEEMGLIRFIAGGAAAMDGTEVVGFDSTVAATAGSEDLDQIQALQVASVQVALMFIQRNAGDNGNKAMYLFHKVTLSADGDLSLIGDEVQTMGFTGVAEKNDGVPETSKFLTVTTYDESA